MTPQEKADNLVNQYRIILMTEDTDCGNEILCTRIAKKCALISVDEVISVIDPEINFKTWEFYKQVKQEIEKL
jgi:hypothetical protein